MEVLCRVWAVVLPEPQGAAETKMVVSKIECGWLPS